MDGYYDEGDYEKVVHLVDHILEEVKNPKNVLDIGCGTGILSIIAIRLGAQHVTAVDVDDVAVRVAKENSRLNNVDSKITVLKAELKEIGKNKYDIVVANIIANVIIDLSKLVPEYIKPNGYFITSGLIKERKDEVIDSYLNQGFYCDSILELGEWVAIAFKCQNSL